MLLVLWACVQLKGLAPRVDSIPQHFLVLYSESLLKGVCAGGGWDTKQCLMATIPLRIRISLWLFGQNVTQRLGWILEWEKSLYMLPTWKQNPLPSLPFPPSHHICPSRPEPRPGSGCADVDVLFQVRVASSKGGMDVGPIQDQAPPCLGNLSVSVLAYEPWHLCIPWVLTWGVRGHSKVKQFPLSPPIETLTRSKLCGRLRK